MTSAEPGQPSAHAGQPPRRRRTRALAAVMALVVAGVLAGILWVQYGAPGGAVARDGTLDTRNPPPSATRTPNPGTVPASASPDDAPAEPGPGASGSASSSPSVTASEPRTTPRSTPRTTTSSRPTTRPRVTQEPDAPAAGGPAAAVRRYYALMPSGTNEGWPLMTSRYQVVQAKSRGVYERFWGQFRRVEVSDVSSDGPLRAVATLTYYRKNGGVESERTAFRFVEEDGRLKIDRSWLVSRSAG